MTAHSTHLVGSALSDPYLSLSAGLNGLAGPLQGLAAQKALKYLLDFQYKYGQNYTEGDIRRYIQATLKEGKDIPGYGHSMLL